MDNLIEIEFRGVRFSVKTPFKVSFHEAKPESMCSNVEKTLQIIGYYTLSAFAGMKEGISYYCELYEEDKVTTSFKTEYKRGKYTITQDFTEHKGDNLLYIIFETFDIELQTSLSLQKVREKTKLDELIQSEINSFMNLVTSYKKLDQYKASFHFYDKGLSYTMESDKCPMGTSFKTIESCNTYNLTPSFKEENIR